MTITLSEAYARATKGPLISEGTRIARPSDKEVIARMAISIPSMRSLPKTEEATATASVMRHAYNLLPELVNMLQIAHTRLIERAESCEENGAQTMGELLRSEAGQLEDTLARAEIVTIPD